MGIYETSDLEESYNNAITDLKSRLKTDKNTYNFWTINDVDPYFSEDIRKSRKPFEKYSKKDDLNRCGAGYANICVDVIPSKGEKRGTISNVKPTGWIQFQYEEVLPSGNKKKHIYMIGLT